MAATLNAVGVGKGEMGQAACPEWVDLDVRMRQVYERHHARLVGFFVRRTHDRPLAEDLAHDTIVRFANAAERFDWERPVWPYLKVTASNLLIDHQRRDEREVVVDLETESDWLELPQAGLEIDDTVALGELLEEAIARLPDRQRIAVELRCRRGWSVTDAADFLGLNRTTFNQLLYRARENLRERLDSVGARTRGFVLPAFMGLKLRLREAFDRMRDVVPTPSAALGAEGLASVVLATTLGVAVAVGGPASTGEVKTASPVPTSGAELVSHEMVLSTAPAPTAGGGAAIEAAPPVAPSVDDAPPDVAGPSADGGRTTVIETPDAIADSDGRVAAGDDDEQFYIAHEVEATTELAALGGNNSPLWVDCNNVIGELVCTSEE